MAFQRGNIPWNKGRKVLQVPWNKGKTGMYSEEMLKKRSALVKEKKLFSGKNNPNYGKHPSEETRHKIGSANRGKTFSHEIKRKLSISRTGDKNPMFGKHRFREQNPNWRNGISTITNLIRNSTKYFEWRQKCLVKDNFTCLKCGTHGGDLNVHHKKLFANLLREAQKYLPLFTPYDAAMMYTPLWDVNNGKTLCDKCHRRSKHRKS